MASSFTPSKISLLFSQRGGGGGAAAGREMIGADEEHGGGSVTWFLRVFFLLSIPSLFSGCYQSFLFLPSYIKLNRIFHRFNLHYR